MCNHDSSDTSSDSDAGLMLDFSHISLLTAVNALLQLFAFSKQMLSLCSNVAAALVVS